MNEHQNLSGVYAAALSPLNKDFSLAYNEIPMMLDFLRDRGCHGCLLFGTTGEGPSFEPKERLKALDVALDYCKVYPDFKLLFGTGTPSLEETIQLTSAAFDRGVDGVVVLPPYYYRKVTDEGLFAWFNKVLEKSVPDGGAFFGYHIPSISGVGLSLDLLETLKTSYPSRFAGIKDSSSDPDLAKSLGDRFGKEMVILSGNDRLLGLALENQASGCITAMANFHSPELRRIWDAFQEGESDPQAQARAEAGRDLFEAFPPAPSMLKFLVHSLFDLPLWTVRPPLMPISPDKEKPIVEKAMEAMGAASDS